MKNTGLCKGFGWRSPEFTRGKGLRNKRKAHKRRLMEAEKAAKRLKALEEQARLEQYSNYDKWE